MQVSVKDSVHIPIYDVDQNLDPGTLLKKFSNLTMGMLLVSEAMLCAAFVNREEYHCCGHLVEATLSNQDKFPAT